MQYHINCPYQARQRVQLTNTNSSIGLIYALKKISFVLDINKNS
jgi:hypothetical protein